MKFFDEFLERERLVKHLAIESLKGSVIGLDAAHFAQQFLVEPLLTALGGAPIALEGFTDAIHSLRDAGIGLHFVFNGLQFGKRNDPFAHSDQINSHNAAAFSQYEQGQAGAARRAFQSLGGSRNASHTIQPC